MKTAIILHGTLGSPDGNWFQWLQKELEAQGITVWLPQLPHAEQPSLDGWHRFVQEYCPFPINEDTLIVGHSSGAILALVLAQNNTEPIGAIVGVSVFYDNSLQWEPNARLFDVQFDWTAIQQGVNKLTFIHSDNDPYVPIDQARYVANNCNAELIVIPDQGHFNTELSPQYKQFPKLLEFIVSNIIQLHLVEPTDPRLNQPSDEVSHHEIHSLEIQNVINGMLEMSAGKGKSKEDSRQMVGLAAPQLGMNKRIVTIDITADGSNKEQNLQVFINPVITKRSAEMMNGREGCWSCGNICGNVERSKQVTLEGRDQDGSPIKFELTDFVARIAQHETDHLDGIRFPDRIPVDQPDRLHWVEHDQFDEYRKNWENWPVKCARERWEEIKG